MSENLMSHLLLDWFILSLPSYSQLKNLNLNCYSYVFRWNSISIKGTCVNEYNHHNSRRIITQALWTELYGSEKTVCLRLKQTGWHYRAVFFSKNDFRVNVYIYYSDLIPQIKRFRIDGTALGWTGYLFEKISMLSR